ncbi:MAG: DUF2125 domain-containing protein [Pseudomonadota bacterium]
MRRVLMIITGVVVLGIGGVSALWFVGQSEAKTRFESALQTAAAQGGFEAEFADVAMSGFPIAYEATFVDLTMINLERGVEVSMPEMRGRVSPANPNSVRLLFPKQFTLVDQTGQFPGGLKIRSEGLTVDITDTGDARGALALNGASLTFEPANPPAMPEFDQLRLTYVDPQITGDFTQNTLANGGDLRFDLTASAIEMEVEAGGAAPRSLSLGTGPIKSALLINDEIARASSTYGDLSLRSIDASGALMELTSAGAEVSAEYSAGDPVQMQAFRSAIVQALNGAEPNALANLDLSGDAGIDVDFVIDAMDIAITGLADGGGQTLRWRSDSAAYSVDIQGETAELASELKGLTINSEGQFNRRGSVEAMALTGVYPTRGSTTPQQIKVTYSINGVEMDDLTWVELNSSGELERSIPGLEIDLALDAVMLRDMFDPSDIQTAPFDVTAVELNGLYLDMLGFRGEATGVVAIENGLPDGLVQVTLTNWRKVLGGLANSSLLGQFAPMVGMATITLETLVAPGAEENESLLNIEFAGEQVIVNDRPLGQPQ